MTFSAIAKSPSQGHGMQRTVFLSLLKAGIQKGETRFTRQAALAWLAAYPGDIEINLLLAHTLFAEKKTAQAQPIVEHILRTDPEYIEAQKLKEQIEMHTGQDFKVNHTRDDLAALGAKSAKSASEWSQNLQSARKHLSEGNPALASDLVQKAILQNPESPLPAIYQLQLLRAEGNFEALHSLAKLYHQKFPECVQFSLYLAEICMQTGEDATAVALLHQCLARDAVGQVATRLWGQDHAYKPLWLDSMAINLDIPIPASIAAVFGWNQLPLANSIESATEIHPSNMDITEEVQSPEQPSNPNQIKEVPTHTQNTRQMRKESSTTIQEELERLAKKLKKPEIARADGRFPVYVILSTKTGLEKKYGTQTASLIESEILHLVSLISQKPGWSALAFLPDDPASTAQLNLKPVPASDPWKIKLSIRDLDAALAKKGQMIGCLLIVGNSEVVPFHRLPNPANDPDLEVPSDNPYATCDENYFIPEWPLGRLPGDNTQDAGLILKLLRQIASQYKFPPKNQPWYRRFNPFRSAIGFLSKSLYISNTRQSFGYSAEVWRKASLAAFRPVGESRSLLVSPPTSTGNINRHGLPPSRLGYFNLHGLADSPAWYGQRDANSKLESPDFPVALTPTDVINGGGSPILIYSEACYGANILNKAEDETLALKFLSSGTHALVGSTCISYGSISSPLIAADLLGYYFWKEVNDGQPAGIALQKAKMNFVKEMNDRQGFLDGEDQKTLISFTLFGDPLASLSLSPTRSKKGASSLRLKSPPVDLITDQPEESSITHDVPQVVLSQVKQIVEQYLPGLRDAEVTLNHIHIKSLAKDQSSVVNPKTLRMNENIKVTLSKQLQSNAHAHTQYAHLTFDKQGKVLKLSMSR